jgi:hypothetical protein
MSKRLGTLLLVLAAGLVGCGGGGGDGGSIPSADADRLVTQLDQVAERADNGSCNSARFQVGELEQKVGALPQSVDADVRQELNEGLDNLRKLVDEQCQERETPTTDTTETAPTTTETTPTETEPTETTEEKKPPKKKKDEDQTTTETTPEQTAPGDGGTPTPGEGQ